MTSIESAHLIPIVAIVGGIGLGGIAIVCSTVYHLFTAQRLISLKREMLERGMSAGEIERICNAGQSTAPPQRQGHMAQKPLKDPVPV